MKKLRGLVDISSGFWGYYGVPADTVTNFALLKQVPGLETDGLIIPDRSPAKAYIGLTCCDIPMEKLQFLPDSLYSGENAGDEYIKDITAGKRKRKIRLIYSLLTGGILRAVVKKRFSTHTVLAGKYYDDFFWKNIFGRHLADSYRKICDSTGYLVSQLTKAEVFFRTNFDLLKPEINTEGYDFVLFSEPTLVDPSPETVKIVRFHDAIPITHPHLVNTKFGVNIARYALRHCVKKGAVFVCNSAASQSVLLNLFPDKKITSFIVPCSVADASPNIFDIRDLKDIVRKKISFISLQSNALTETKKSEIILKSEKIQTTPYIIAVANINPKKNQGILLEGWKQYRLKHGSALKLVMIANIGWKEGAVFEKMRAHVLSGDIVHLKNVPKNDVMTLLANAKAYVSSSVAEGFGMGILEAARCGCPVIASDIDAHKYVMGENAYFFDPFSAEELANRLSYILDERNKEAVGKTVSCALNDTRVFLPENVITQWKKVIDFVTLKTKNRQSGKSGKQINLSENQEEKI